MRTEVMMFNGLIWTNPDFAGLLPEFLNSNDPRPAREQFNENYQHGGGWRPITGRNQLHFSSNVGRSCLLIGGDWFKEVCRTKLRKEVIIVYESGMVAIVQENLDFEVARMD
jgi:hypothetical protein